MFDAVKPLCYSRWCLVPPPVLNSSRLPMGTALIYPNYWATFCSYCIVTYTFPSLISFPCPLFTWSLLCFNDRFVVSQSFSLYSEGEESFFISCVVSLHYDDKAVVLGKALQQHFFKNTATYMKEHKRLWCVWLVVKVVYRKPCQITFIRNPVYFVPDIYIQFVVAWVF